MNGVLNQPPVADAGASQTIILPNNSISLDGTKSADPDGSIGGYAWIMLSGPSTATIKNANTSTPAVSGLVAGNYVFQLTVTDNNGATGTALVKIIADALPNTNQPPVASAGGDQTIVLPVNSVTLDGEGSTDADGTIAGYKWTKVSGPAQGNLSGAGNATAQASSLVVGIYNYQLVVTDDSGDTDTDMITVTVNPAANQLPLADAGSGQSITLPVSTVSLDGSNSSDPDGTIDSYAWNQVSGPSGASINHSNAVTPSVSGLIAGKYMFQLTVTDNNGATAAAQVKIIVNAGTQPNQSPVANAGVPQTIVSPANSVILDGTNSADADGSVVNYSWTEISGPTDGTITGDGNNATVSADNLAEGVYTYQLVVTDDSGATGTDTVTVTVNSPDNQLPVANAGSDNTITLPVSSVSLDGSNSSDPGGTIESYAWVQLSGSSDASFNDPNSSIPTVSGLQAGTYYFQLTVTDDNQNTGTAIVKITVIAAYNQPPVANAGGGQTSGLTENSVALHGTCSIYPEGTIIK